MSSEHLPIIGVAAAVAVTTTMDATGNSVFSAQPLFPLMCLFWWLERMSRREMGFVLGGLKHYGDAVLYPITVMGAITVTAFVFGAVDVSQTDWPKTGLNLALISVSTFLVVILTEEGFFRGWLWASLARRGPSPARTIVWTSVAFALWHLSAVSLETGFDLPWRQIPIYMVNATLLGAIWGMLRWRSGSVIVASLSHGLWNGLAYVLFGYGTKVGALGIANTVVFGPEVGLLGILFNSLFLLVLWRTRPDAPESDSVSG